MYAIKQEDLSAAGDHSVRLKSVASSSRNRSQAAEFPIRDMKEAPSVGRCERGLFGVIMGVLPNCLKRRSAEADSVQ